MSFGFFAEHFVPLPEYRSGVHHALILIYLAIATVPQLDPSLPARSPDRGFPLWAGVWVGVALILAAFCDFKHRPPMVRALLVAVGLAAYACLMWPVVWILGRAIGLDSAELPEDVARLGWAFLGASAGLPLVIVSLRSCRLLRRRPT